MIAKRLVRCPHVRDGFSLIELITAMLASTVLVASLAATVAISTQLLEVPPDDHEVWHDRFITDRLAADLRYATSVDENVTHGFQIVRNDPGGGSETVSYEAYLDGLTRQVSGEPVTNLDSEAPTRVHYVDGYSRAHYIASGKYARVRSANTAASDAAVTNLALDVPPAASQMI